MMMLKYHRHCIKSKQYKDNGKRFCGGKPVASKVSVAVEGFKRDLNFVRLSPDNLTQLNASHELETTLLFFSEN